MKSVLVMMSAYNGEKYISQQIDSILCQSDVAVSLVIRNDGSTDSTQKIIQAYADHDERVSLEEGNNLGFMRSFYKVLKGAPMTYDYYAFSDQDDVWDPDKLISAIRKIQGGVSKKRLYASGLRCVDQDLNFISENTFPRIRISYGSALSRQRLAGCTFVFNKELMVACQKFDITEQNMNFFSHDAAVYYICLACGGEVYFEPNSHMNYRRHKNTTTEQGLGLMKRVWSVTNIFTDFRDRRYDQVKNLLQIYENEMPEDVLILSNKIKEYRNSPIKTLSLAFDGRLRCGIRSVDIVNVVAILMRRY